jgi:CMP-N,N'-diacetyllegionaminic acid synthase
MIDGEKVLAIIPARGGSKRLLRKNVLPLAGKPLIAWTIKAALDSDIFDEVMVNTDDLEIAETAKLFGAKIPFMRPEELASDTASSIDVIKHTLLWYQKKGIDFTDVVLLQPTSPLRTSADINTAYKYYIDKQASSVLSVCEVDHPSRWCNVLKESLSMDDFIKDADKNSRSEDFDKEYRLNGAIYILSVEKFLEQNSTILEPSFASIMSRNCSIDIDEKIDFDIAECLIGKRT